MTDGQHCDGCALHDTKPPGHLVLLEEAKPAPPAEPDPVTYDPQVVSDTLAFQRYHCHGDERRLLDDLDRGSSIRWPVSA